MAAHDEMEETWGIAATHADHHINDHIHYRVDGQKRTGAIIWICAPADQAGQLLPTRYVVQPDERATGLDLVCPGTILIDEVQQQQADESHSTASPGLEQAVIQMLATISIPIIVKVETDDNGQHFYVWHIGESTPQQPFGLYAGTNRQLIDALSLALEKLIKHVGHQP